MKTGFILINKPKDWTSQDAVCYLKNQIRQQNENKKEKFKIGHAGTLDPFATGLLIIGVGREATKHLDDFKNQPKTYEAVIKLGETSNTDDSTGIITPSPSPVLIPSKKEIKKILKTFLGKQTQIPPMFSAKKINGERLYALARAGVEIERKPIQIEFYKLKLLKYQPPTITIRVVCSAGTYIRTLAHDLGDKLGTGAFCDELTRTKIGKYKLKKAAKIPLTNLIDNRLFL